MLIRSCAALACLATAPLAAPTFEQHWQDGQAEVSGYRLTINRYGEDRVGQAVMIFVTEPFSASRFVKVDDPAANPGDTFEALKLNFVRDFQTGVYDYNTMVSVFTRSSDFSPMKISFSAQEWCGHVYEEMLFHPDRITNQIFSYFEGESASGELDVRPDAVAEDALLILLRGLRGDFLAPNESRDVPFILSPFHRRLRHMPLHWEDAQITRLAETEQIEVPAGTFEAIVYEVRLGDQPVRRYHIEAAYPHRVLRWAFGTLERGELTGSERMPYWNLHDAGDQSRLTALGLQPLPTPTP